MVGTLSFLKQGWEIAGEYIRGSADDRADVGDHRQCEDQFGNLLGREPSFREAEMFAEQQAAEVGFNNVGDDTVQQGQQGRILKRSHQQRTEPDPDRSARPPERDGGEPNG